MDQHPTQNFLNTLLEQVSEQPCFLHQTNGSLKNCSAQTLLLLWHSLLRSFCQACDQSSNRCQKNPKDSECISMLLVWPQLGHMPFEVTHVWHGDGNINGRVRHTFCTASEQNKGFSTCDACAKQPAVVNLACSCNRLHVNQA